MIRILMFMRVIFILLEGAMGEKESQKDAFSELYFSKPFFKWTRNPFVLACCKHAG